jgi:hypothetical protein
MRSARELKGEMYSFVRTGYRVAGRQPYMAELAVDDSAIDASV